MKKIPLFRRDAIVAYAEVDDEDFGTLSQFTWRLHSKGYATRSESRDGKEYRLMMHREVLDAGALQVDHIDKDKLNNTKKNLRVATNSQNQHNADAKTGSITGVRGVTWEAERNKYRARVMLDGKIIHLGRFDTLDEAELVVIEWKNKTTGQTGFDCLSVI